MNGYDFKLRMQELSGGLLSENFKTQLNKFTKDGNDEQIVKVYLSDFRKLKDKYPHVLEKMSDFPIPPKERKDIDKYRDFSQLETIVDFAKGQVELNNSLFDNIEVNGKPIYENDVVEVYYADSPRACVKYKGNVPYSWCISRTDEGNMYYTYRMKEHEPTFYFVKIKDRAKKELGLWNMTKNVFSGTFKDKYHFFVLQVLKNADINNKTQKQYIITSAMNDGDKEVSWAELLEIEPRLEGIQGVFKPIPLTKDEKEIYDRFKKGISDDEFCKLEYRLKRRYLDVYVRIDRHLSNKQFSCMPGDLKGLYINFGVPLTVPQLKNIQDNKKLLKNYRRVTEKLVEEYKKGKLKSIYETQILILNERYKNDVIPYLTDQNVSYLLGYATNKNQMENTIIKYKRNNLTDSNVYDLLKYATDKDQIIDIIIKYKGNNLTSENVFDLLKYATNKNKMANILRNKNINKLTGNNIYVLLKYADSKKQMANILGRENINKLTNENIHVLLENAIDKYEMANILGRENINKLTDKAVFNLLTNPQDQNQIENIIIKYKGDNLTSENVYDLLEYTKNQNKIADILGSENINKLTDKNVHDLLFNSTDKNQIENIIVKYKGDNLTSKNVYDLLFYSTDKKQMADILGIENINKLTYDHVYYLLINAHDQNQMANILGNENINKLTNNEIYILLENPENLSQTADILGSENISKLTDKDDINGLLKNAIDKYQMANIFLKYHTKLSPETIEELKLYVKNINEQKLRKTIQNILLS